MNRTTFLLTLGLAALAGCGGNVVVDHGTGGAGNAPGAPSGNGLGGSGGTTTATSMSVTATTGTVSNTTDATIAASSSATTTPGCNTCAQVEAGADPNAICPVSAQVYQDLLSCSCRSAGACLTGCASSFCAHQSASVSCVNCQQTGCAAELAACQAM